MQECSEEVHLEGHLIDSLVLAKILDKIVELGGDFEILDFVIGKTNKDQSRARILIKAGSKPALEQVLEAVKKLGVMHEEERDVALEPAPGDTILPKNFYSTTNHPTLIRLGGKWVEVKDPRMDCVIVVENTMQGKARTKKIKDVRNGDLIVVRSGGVRVLPPQRPRERSKVFDFMVSKISSEKPSETTIKKIAEEIARLKGKIAVVAGPAIVHTGGVDHLVTLIKKGYVNALLAGNALAVHDIEHALFGTSLGISIETGESMEGGHRNHLRAINAIRGAGSIRGAITSGILTKGIMHACIEHGVPFVLAGSIRDDGPLPEVVTDVLQAQDQMAELLRPAEMVLLLASTLHAIAAGNLLPSSVKTVCVDINPAVVTKLIDRGSAQAIGIVEDVGLFLAKLREFLP
ncbi:MAG: TIGR00300 family protein [Candidatus Sigynarchaeota archaeon]